MLLKKQANEIFLLITSLGLDPNNFNIDYQDSNKNRVALIVHKPSGYYFKMQPGVVKRNSFEVAVLHLLYTPDIANILFHVKKERQVPSTEKWSDVIASISSWLTILKEELDAPDLWAEAAKTAQLFAPASTPTDDKFTRTELAEVQGQLRLLQQSFAASALPEAAKQKLIEITVNVSVAAETQTKRDWLGLMVGSFTGAVFSLALNPTQAAEVIKLVKAAFGGLFLH